MKKLAVLAVFCSALMGLVLHFPLSWIGALVLPKNISPKPVLSGTVWQGSVSGIPQIGVIHTYVSVINLFTGQPPLSFESRAPYLQFSGTAGIKGSIAVSLQGDVLGMTSIDRRFSGLRGTYSLTLSDMISGSGCEVASGTFTSDILQRNRDVWRWLGPALSGPVSCEAGDVVLNVSGRDNMNDIQAIIRIGPSGTYRAEIDVTTQDPNIDTVLPIFGFQKNGPSYRLLEAGRWY